jgi:hypothetical protein
MGCATDRWGAGVPVDAGCPMLGLTTELGDTVGGGGGGGDAAGAIIDCGGANGLGSGGDASLPLPTGTATGVGNTD